MHQEALKLASSQEQNAAQAMAQLSEVEKQRDQLEQRTIAQQVKIENTVQVSLVPRPCTCSYIVCCACAASQKYTWKGVTYILRIEVFANEIKSLDQQNCPWLLDYLLL